MSLLDFCRYKMGSLMRSVKVLAAYAIMFSMLQDGRTLIPGHATRLLQLQDGLQDYTMVYYLLIAITIPTIYTCMYGHIW